MSYGYLWWTVNSPIEAILAWGYGGQFIAIIPEHNLVVVTTTNWILLSQDRGPTWITEAAMEVIFEGVLSAVD